MKTLYKNIKNSGEAIAKRKQLEAKTGLKLSCYPVGDGWQFRPYMHEGIKQDQAFADVVLKVLNLKNAISFTAIADRTGLSVETTLEACAHLYYNHYVFGEVGRDGKVVGIYRRE